MNKETLDALKGSIKKWNDIAQGTGSELGCFNCPLCKLFFDKKCQECPVHNKTHKYSCLGSPYELWTKTVKQLPKPTNTADTPLLVEIAKEEVRFLESLLPKEPEFDFEDLLVNPANYMEFEAPNRIILSEELQNALEIPADLFPRVTLCMLIELLQLIYREAKKALIDKTY